MANVERNTRRTGSTEIMCTSFADLHHLMLSFDVLVASAPRNGRLNAIEELEDHLDDLLDAAELEARVSNTIAAAKLVAPAAWKASQDECASFLGKL